MKRSLDLVFRLAFNKAAAPMQVLRQGESNEKMQDMQIIAVQLKHCL